MKNIIKQWNKINKMTILLFICIISLVIGHVFFMNKEGMSDYVDFSDYKTVDRIKTTGGTTFSYCIGGSVKCNKSGGNLQKITDTSYTSGDTYQSTCDDNSDVICTDNVFSTVQDYNLSDYLLPYYVVDISKNPYVFPLSSTNKGFTQPYNYNPIKYDTSDNILFYDNVNSFPRHKLHICNMFTYDHQIDCYHKFFGKTGTSSAYSNSVKDNSDDSTDYATVDDDSSSTKKTYSDETCANDKIPCVADFGTNIGDDLCCGQSGVLQNTKYVCPKNRPTCSNFKCGSQFGNCL